MGTGLAQHSMEKQARRVPDGADSPGIVSLGRHGIASPVMVRLGMKGRCGPMGYVRAEYGRLGFAGLACLDTVRRVLAGQGRQGKVGLRKGWQGPSCLCRLGHARRRSISLVGGADVSSYHSFSLSLSSLIDEQEQDGEII